MSTIFKSPAGEKAVMDLYDSLLAHWPVPYQGLHLPTRHGETFVIASGDEARPPLILIHGAGSNSTVWAGDADYLTNFRTYAVDLLGEAGKSAPNRPDWNSPAYAEWLEDVLDGLKIEKTALLGMSQGGWTALKFATYKPERVAKLVLLCPGGVVPDRKSFVFRAIFLALLGKSGMRRLVQQLYGDQPIPDGVTDVISVILRNFKSRIGTVPVFSDDELRRLTMPTLLIGGTKDIVRDHAQIAARLQSLLPTVQVVTVPGAGHVLSGTPAHVVPFLTAN
ncbi:MAG TPA: alpha/beta hydrolase [Aggregatilineaceae bacterium]|nr:alpha/beta hydrolase [Aggregatilineaceae bacterium]